MDSIKFPGTAFSDVRMCVDKTRSSGATLEIGKLSERRYVSAAELDAEVQSRTTMLNVVIQRAVWRNDIMEPLVLSGTGLTTIV